MEINEYNKMIDEMGTGLESGIKLGRYQIESDDTLSKKEKKKALDKFNKLEARVNKAKCGHERERKEAAKDYLEIHTAVDSAENAIKNQLEKLETNPKAAALEILSIVESLNKFASDKIDELQ